MEALTDEDESYEPEGMAPESNDIEGKKRDDEIGWRMLVDLSGNAFPGG